MSNEELKPCPFCGAPAEYDSQRWNGIDVHDKSNKGHAVYCTECPLPASGGCLQFDTKEEAFEQWNRRAAPSDAAQAPRDTWELIREINGGGAEPIASLLWTAHDALRAIIHARDAGQDAALILDENSPLVDAARAALSAPLAAQAPHDKPTPLDDETVSVIRSFVDRPGETYRGCITNRLGIGFGRALRRAIEESRIAPQAAGDAAQAPAVPVELSGVKEALENGDGFWRTCSGCHETEDGYDVGHYPFSDVLNCTLGGGCSECGGIGAVWDSTDYADMAEFCERWTASAEQFEEWWHEGAHKFRNVGEKKDLQLTQEMAKTIWDAARAAPVPPAAAAPSMLTDEGMIHRSDLARENLTVWYGAMPESNGKSNWTAILHNGDIATGITLDRSEYPDRVRYEADRARWLIGELAEEPFILDYDANKHSGYVKPAAHPTVAADAAATSDTRFMHPGCECCTCPPGVCQSEAAQPDERAACDRYSVLDEAGDALLKAGYNEAYEVVYRLMKEARATAPQSKPDERAANEFTDQQILDALSEAGVAWQQQRSLAQGWQVLTHGSTPAADIIAGIRALLDARATAPQASKGDERAYAVYRTRPDENDGKEYFSVAHWHNDYIAQEGERILTGWFVPDRAAVPQATVKGDEPFAWRWKHPASETWQLSLTRPWFAINDPASVEPLFARAAVPQAEQRMSDAERECEWTYDDVDFKWDSACGESWAFNDDGPAENNARFCQGCGGKIKIAARKGASDAD